jgi:hypothetical protein
MREAFYDLRNWVLKEDADSEIAAKDTRIKKIESALERIADWSISPINDQAQEMKEIAKEELEGK